MLQRLPFVSLNVSRTSAHYERDKLWRGPPVENVISEYNFHLVSRLRESKVFFFLPVLILLFFSSSAWTQVAGKNASSPPPEQAERGITLAENGHCVEALPVLKRAIRFNKDRELEKRIGLAGLHCAMTHNAPYESLTFLDALNRDFPRDPEVLYAATHAFSDLSLMTSQQLAREAPFAWHSRPAWAGINFEVATFRRGGRASEEEF